MSAPYGHAECEACGDRGCQKCCEHQDHDHYICIDCGHQGEASDYYNEDDWREDR